MRSSIDIIFYFNQKPLYVFWNLGPINLYRVLNYALYTDLASSMSGFNGSSPGDPSGDPSIVSVCPPENAVSEPIPVKML